MGFGLGAGVEEVVNWVYLWGVVCVWVESKVYSLASLWVWEIEAAASSWLQVFLPLQDLHVKCSPTGLRLPTKLKAPAS